MMPPVLLIGVDTPTGLTILRELGSHNVPVHCVGSAKGIGAASRYCTKLWPRPQRPMAQWVPELIAQSGAKLLIAWSENDLIALSQLPDRIGNCDIATPRAEQLNMVLDKARTLALARSMGIDTPVNWTGTPDRWPVVVKWADPMRVMPMLDAAGLDFVKAEFCRDARELGAVLTRYAGLAELPLVQSYAEGRGIGQMFHMIDGKATLFFQHERLHEWPPEGGVSTLCRSVPPDLHRAQRAKSEALLAAMDWQGPAMVEYRFDGTRYTLMEVNGRFWGSQPLARASGVEFGWEVYRHYVVLEGRTVAPAKAGASGGITPRSQRPPPARGRRIARYMLPETKRLIRLWLHRHKIADPFFKPRPVSDTLDYITGYFRPSMHYYIWDWRDPMPFFRDCANIIRKAARSGKAAPADPPPGQSAQNKSGNSLPTA